MRQGVVTVIFSALAIFTFSLSGCTKSCSKSASQRVFFTNIEDGAKVPEVFNVQFGVAGMTLRKAGEAMTDKSSGHHHILINNTLGYIPKGEVIPMNDNNLHFGQAQTEATLNLTPGEHKISLQFGDGAHLSYGEDMATSIHVVVENPSTIGSGPKK